MTWLRRKAKCLVISPMKRKKCPMPTIITNSIRTSKCPTSLTSMRGASSHLASNRVQIPTESLPRVVLHQAKNQGQSSPVANPRPLIRQVSNSMAFRETPRISKTDQKLRLMTPMAMIKVKTSIRLGIIKGWLQLQGRKTRAFLSSRSKMRNQKSNRRTYFQMKNNRLGCRTREDLSSSSLIHRLSKPTSYLTLKTTMMQTPKRTKKLRLTFYKTLPILTRHCRRHPSITILRSCLRRAPKSPGKATPSPP